MSNPIEAPESPDYFVTPTKGEGTRSVNWKPKAIGMAFCLLIVIGVGYTVYARSVDMERSAASDAEIKKVDFAVPPVKKPSGPDVYFPEVRPVEAGHGYMPGQQPMQVDESAKQAALKKAAELDAAMKASAGVDKFSKQAKMAQSNMIPAPPRAGPPPPAPPDLYDEDGMKPGGNQDGQDSKRDFLASKNDYSPYLEHTREQPRSGFEVKAGFIIPGIMLSGINSQLPGQIIGQVRQNVYDSATGKYLLIPAGARLVGTYDSGVSGGQERVLVAWNRIIFPDSSSVFLDTMAGADKSGIAGFHDQVNNHYMRTFGQAFMLSLFSAGMQLSQPRGAVGGTYNAQQIGAAAMGQQMAQLGMQLARRNLNMAPTLEIRPGYLFDIMINKDMILPPWRGHPAALSKVSQGGNEDE